MLFKIYRSLLQRFGAQRWWPAEGGFQPKEWEVCVGAILTQNTNWNNVVKALQNLRSANILSPNDIENIGSNKLEELVRPSGFFSQKAARLKEFAKFVLKFGNFEKFLSEISREGLLSVNGIGKETADSILLYAAGKPYFVVDAYTRRVLSRIGMIDENLEYDDIRLYMEYQLGSAEDAARHPAVKEEELVKLYNEYHALLVALAKNICTKEEPACSECPISSFCKFGCAKLGKPQPQLIQRGTLTVLGGH